MLDPGKLQQALQARRQEFQESDQATREGQAALLQALEMLSGMSLAAVGERLVGVEWPGAYPTVELETQGTAALPFAQRWANHRQARQWALQVLQGVPTFAVDGSQIAPGKDCSIPVALVQAGWFETPHRPGEPYVKDVALEVLGPQELGAEEGEEGTFPAWPVNYRRFLLEVSCLVQYMQQHAGDHPAPLCFFDGSLVLSFIRHMDPQHQQLYLQAMDRLLTESRHTGVPLVGYVDTSYAHDLTALLGHLAGLERGIPVSDAALLQPLLSWGDRSQAFVCARDDQVLSQYRERMCFAYLQTTADNPPARVEFPYWMYEAGGYEAALDIVRAECVVGTGYPYALETADAVAVLSVQDQERFLRIFQEHLEGQGLTLRFSRKAVSKRRRRV